MERDFAPLYGIERLNALELVELELARLLAYRRELLREPSRSQHIIEFPKGDPEDPEDPG